MSRNLIPALLLIGTLCLVTFSFAQPTETIGDNESKLLDVLRPGQTVFVREQAGGFQIQIMDEDDIAGGVEAIKRSRERFGTPPRNKRTPEEAFAITHPKVKSVLSDHVVLESEGDRHERLIASRAIVEILRPQSRN